MPSLCNKILTVFANDKDCESLLRYAFKLLSLFHKYSCDTVRLVENLPSSMLHVLDIWIPNANSKFVIDACKLLTAMLHGSYDVKELYTTQNNASLLESVLIKMVKTYSNNCEMLQIISSMIDVLCSSEHDENEKDSETLLSMRKRHQTLQFHASVVMIQLYQILIKQSKNIAIFPMIGATLFRILENNANLQTKFDEKCDWCIQFTSLIKTGKVHVVNVILPFLQLFNESYYKQCKSLKLLPRYIKCLIEVIKFYDGEDVTNKKRDIFIVAGTMLSEFMKSTNKQIQSIVLDEITIEVYDRFLSIVNKRSNDPEVLRIYCSLLQLNYIGSKIQLDLHNLTNANKTEYLHNWVEHGISHLNDEDILMEVIQLITLLAPIWDCMNALFSFPETIKLFECIFLKYTDTANISFNGYRSLGDIWKLLGTVCVKYPLLADTVLNQITNFETFVHRSLILKNDCVKNVDTDKDVRSIVNRVRMDSGIVFAFLRNTDHPVFHRWASQQMSVSDIVEFMSSMEGGNFIESEPVINHLCDALHTHMLNERMATIHTLRSVPSYCSIIYRCCIVPYFNNTTTARIAIRAVDILELVLNDDNDKNQLAIIQRELLELPQLGDELLSMSCTKTVSSLEAIGKLIKIMLWCDSSNQSQSYEGNLKPLGYRIAQACKDDSLKHICSSLISNKQDEFVRSVWRMLAIASQSDPMSLIRFSPAMKQLLCHTTCGQLIQYKSDINITENILIVIANNMNNATTEIINKSYPSILRDVLGMAEEYNERNEIVTTAIVMTRMLNVSANNASETLLIALRLFRKSFTTYQWTNEMQKDLYKVMNKLIDYDAAFMDSDSAIHTLVISCIEDAYRQDQLEGMTLILDVMMAAVNISKTIVHDFSFTPIIYNLLADLAKSYCDDDETLGICEKTIKIIKFLITKEKNVNCVHAIQQFMAVSAFPQFLVNLFLSRPLSCERISDTQFDIAIIIDQSIACCIHPPDFASMEGCDKMIMTILGEELSANVSYLVCQISNQSSSLQQRLWVHDEYFLKLLESVQFLSDEVNPCLWMISERHYMIALQLYLDNYLSQTNPKDILPNEFTNILHGATLLLASSKEILNCVMITTAFRSINFISSHYRRVSLTVRETDMISQCWENIWIIFNTFQASRLDENLIHVSCMIIPFLVSLVCEQQGNIECVDSKVKELCYNMVSLYPPSSETAKMLLVTTMDLIDIISKHDESISLDYLVRIMIEDISLSTAMFNVFIQQQNDRSFISSHCRPLMLCLHQTLTQPNCDKLSKADRLVCYWLQTIAVCFNSECGPSGSIPNLIDWLELIQSLPRFKTKDIIEQNFYRRIYSSVNSALLEKGTRWSSQFFFKACHVLIRYIHLWKETLSLSYQSYELYTIYLQRLQTDKQIQLWLQYMIAIFETAYDAVDGSVLIMYFTKLLSTVSPTVFQNTPIKFADKVCTVLLTSSSVLMRLFAVEGILKVITTTKQSVSADSKHILASSISNLSIQIHSLPSQLVCKEIWFVYHRFLYSLLHNNASLAIELIVVVFHGVVWLCEQPDEIAAWFDNIPESLELLSFGLHNAINSDVSTPVTLGRIGKVLGSLAEQVATLNNTTISTECISLLLKAATFLVRLKTDYETVDHLLLISCLLMYGTDKACTLKLNHQMCRTIISSCEILLTCNNVRMNVNMCKSICKLLARCCRPYGTGNCGLLLNNLFLLVQIHLNEPILKSICSICYISINDISFQNVSKVMDGLLLIVPLLTQLTTERVHSSTAHLIKLIHKMTFVVSTDVDNPKIAELSGLNWGKLCFDVIESCENDSNVLMQLADIAQIPFVGSALKRDSNSFSVPITLRLTEMIDFSTPRLALIAALKLLIFFVPNSSNDKLVAALMYQLVNSSNDSEVLREVCRLLTTLCENDPLTIEHITTFFLEKYDTMDNEHNMISYILHVLDCQLRIALHSDNHGTIKAIFNLFRLFVKYTNDDTPFEDNQHIQHCLKLLKDCFKSSSCSKTMLYELDSMQNELYTLTESDTTTASRVNNLKESVELRVDNTNMVITASELTINGIIDVNIYKGTWRKSTPIAIKINRSKKSIADEAINAELQRLLMLRHPRIISVLGCCNAIPINGSDTSDTMTGLILEYMGKGNLRTVLNAEHTIMSWASKLTIAVDVCEGMEFLHESKVVHGSLSSENVLVDAHGRAKLIGLTTCSIHDQPKPQSRLLACKQNEPTKRLTKALSLQPEISAVIEQKDDVFCFGLILWELNTGRKLPYSDPSQCKKHIKKLTLSNEEAKKCLPIIVAMMKHCLEIKATDRPAFSDLSDTLHQLHIQETKRWNDQLRVIPDGFICPITQDVMKDPVMLMDGHSYERKAIEDWLKRSSRSPMTNQSLPNTTLKENYALKSSIESFLKGNNSV